MLDFPRTVCLSDIVLTGHRSNQVLADICSEPNLSGRNTSCATSTCAVSSFMRMALAELFLPCANAQQVLPVYIHYSSCSQSGNSRGNLTALLKGWSGERSHSNFCQAHTGGCIVMYTRTAVANFKFLKMSPSLTRACPPRMCGYLNLNLAMNLAMRMLLTV